MVQSPPPPLCLFCHTGPPRRPTLFPYTTLFRSLAEARRLLGDGRLDDAVAAADRALAQFTDPAPRRLCDEVRATVAAWRRSEEHTSELQSRGRLVCRLLLAKKHS